MEISDSRIARRPGQAKDQNNAIFREDLFLFLQNHDELDAVLGRNRAFLLQ